MAERVGIVGSGITGSGIAEVAAKAGSEVVMRSRSQSTADAMVAGLEKSLAKQVDRGKLEDGARTDILGRVSAISDLGGLAQTRVYLRSLPEQPRLGSKDQRPNLPGHCSVHANPILPRR